MCGRYVLKTLTADLERAFDAPATADFPPSYNIAPTRVVPVVREITGHGREIAAARWGLVPSWSKGPDHRYSMINARAESVAKRPAYRGPLRRRRCLVPADGFYEWKRDGSRKQPWLVRMRDGSVFAFAGLWDLWEGSGEQVIESCAIITTGANDLMAPIHDRMPVILPQGHWREWLDPSNEDTESLTALLTPRSGSDMTARPVSTRVNSTRNDDPSLLDPVDAGNGS